MRVAEVRVTIRKNLGNYEHEEFSATVVADAEEKDTADAMMAEARRVCVHQTTAYLQYKKNQEEK